MSFEPKYSNQAKKFLKKSEKEVTNRILIKIEKLCENPVIHDSKTIEGSHNLFRVRVGDYRILYEVDHTERIIGIVKIDKRESVYLH